MNIAEYKYRKGGSNESPFFIHKKLFEILFGEEG